MYQTALNKEKNDWNNVTRQQVRMKKRMEEKPLHIAIRVSELHSNLAF